MITGEPTPAEKQAGAQVLAGTIPSQGKLRMRARQIGEATALSHIIRMVEAAQSSKPPVQRIVDRAALLFVPTVALISLVTFLSWWILGGTALLPHAILSAVAVLVIACPCAMGLATPTALMVSIGKAAQQQILVKDATALELLRKVDALRQDRHADHPPRRPRLHEVGPPAARGARTAQAPRPRGHGPSAPGGH